MFYEDNTIINYILINHIIYTMFLIFTYNTYNKIITNKFMNGI